MKTKPKWPPPFTRRAASTRARYKREGLCHECGSGFDAKSKPGTIVLRAHHPSCPVLKEMARLERSGICAQCLSKKKTGVRWLQSMQMVERHVWCPKGHGYGMTLLRPQYATAAERRELGLVRLKRRSGEDRQQHTTR